MHISWFLAHFLLIWHPAMHPSAAYIISISGKNVPERGIYVWDIVSALPLYLIWPSGLRLWISFLFYPFLEIIKKKNLFYYNCTNFPLPVPSSAHPTSHSHSQFPHCCPVCGSFIHVLCLVPSPFFHRYPPSPLVTFSLISSSQKWDEGCLKYCNED